MGRKPKNQPGVPAVKPDAPKPEGSGEKKPAPPVKSDAVSGNGSHRKFDKFKTPKGEN